MKLKTLCLGLLMVLSVSAKAYETDQFYTTFYDLKDSTDVLDQVVNDGINDIVVNWNGKRDDTKLLKKIFKKFSSREFELWINNSPQVDSLYARNEGIYRTTGAMDSPIIRYKGIASTIVINGVHIGADKISHFFGVGAGYYNKALEYPDQPYAVQREKAIAWGKFTERTYWGEATTRVYSNADLTSNYNGYQLYRSLLEDNVIPGKSAEIGWNGDRPFIKRPFTFRDFVDDYWSEALNPCMYYGSLHAKVVNVMQTFCERPDYNEKISRFRSTHEAELEAKYKDIGYVRDYEPMTLDAVCQRYNVWPEAKKAEFRKSEASLIEDYKKTLASDPVRFSDQKQTWQDTAVDWVPMCYDDAKRGRDEFNIMSAWSKSIAVQVDASVQLSLEKNLGTIHTLLASEKDLNLDAGVESQLLSLLVSGTVMQTVQPAVLLNGTNTYELKAMLTAGINQKVPVAISHKRLNDGSDIICSDNDVQGLDMNGTYDKTTHVTLSKCYQVKADGTTKELETRYLLDNRYRSRVSQAGFYDMNDKVGFVARSLPTLCKKY